MRHFHANASFMPLLKSSSLFETTLLYHPQLYTRPSRSDRKSVV